MTQRNPMNERYQRDDLGKTRKSASSAKPVTKAAASVRIEGKSSTNDTGLFGRARKQAEKSSNKKSQQKKSNNELTREQRALYYNPDTPEYKIWRRWWWITIVAAIVLTTLSFVWQLTLAESTGTLLPSYVMLILGYAMLAVAIWIDIAKVRKLRNNYAQRMAAGGAKSKAATRARKEAKAQAKAAAEAKAAEAEDKEAAYQQSQNNRKGLVAGLFGRAKAGEPIPAKEDDAS